MMQDVAEIRQKKYRVNGIHMNVAEIGVGEPLVFIHGWSNSWLGWTLLAEELAHHYKLYMVDMPGFGDSDELERYSIDVQSDYIAQFIESNGIQPLAITGASLGTIIAGNTLKNYPHLSNNLILLGTVFNRVSLQRTKVLYYYLLRILGKTKPTEKLLGTTIKSRYAAYVIERFYNAYAFDREMVDKYNLPRQEEDARQLLYRDGLVRVWL